MNNDIFRMASVHFGPTISCLKPDIWFICSQMKREEINSGLRHQHRENNLIFEVV